ncbi:uncharacterized protein LOC124416816 isoform X2 [Diprion similis]|uniref:uncharacterized protein LOC124416816 isoform X2 n=1 Tax=Diprion similis TaxID=362088 RepID=UPI001EF86C07|nr:uncharacterized protein LOC124416816 isoform X2 [Diprion similis]
MEFYFDHSGSATGSNIRGCPGATGLHSAVGSIFEKPSDERGAEKPTDDRTASVPAELRCGSTEFVVAIAPASAHASETTSEQHTSVRTKAAASDATTTTPASDGPASKGHEQRSDGQHDALRPIALLPSHFGLRRHDDGKTFLHGTDGPEHIHNGRTEASSAYESATNAENGSAQFQKSSNGLQDQTRSKREIRDVAPVESGPKKFRQSKNSRQQMDGMAANPSVKPKSDNNAVSSLQQNSQSPSKSNDDRIVGDVRKMNDDTVAGPLDDFIETLKNSGLVNPLMDLLNGGGVLPQSNFLGKSESGIPQFEEHIVSQPHQQQQQLGDQNPMMSMLGHHHNPPYTSYGHHHPHHLPTHYGSRPTKYYPYRNMASGSSSLPMNEGGSIPFQDNQGQAFWAGSPHQVQPGTSSSSNSNSAVPESVSKASNPAAKFVKDPVIKFSMSQRKNEDPVIVAPNPNSSKAAKPSETPKPIASESPMNPAPIESQPMMPVQGAIGKQRVLGSQYPMNMVPQTMIKMMSPYNSMMRSMSPMVGAPSPTDQLSGLLYTLADQLSTFGNGGGQYAATNDRYQNYREANFGLGDLLDRGYGSYPGQLSYGTIPGIGYDESPYSTFGGYNTPYQYHQHSHSF